MSFLRLPSRHLQHLQHHRHRHGPSARHNQGKFLRCLAAVHCTPPFSSTFLFWYWLMKSRYVSSIDVVSMPRFLITQSYWTPSRFYGWKCTIKGGNRVLFRHFWSLNFWFFLSEYSILTIWSSFVGTNANREWPGVLHPNLHRNIPRRRSKFYDHIMLFLPRVVIARDLAAINLAQLNYDSIQNSSWSMIRSQLFGSFLTSDLVVS